jgi:bifunctional N-acetylglucosamine-1-phosphate-uridyltransferase/glucosamine-1-phosphate-acetyltransferase GlmU-like protein
MYGPNEFFDFSEGEHRELFAGVERVWEVLPKIKPYLQSKVVSNLEELLEEGPFLSQTAVLTRGRLLKRGFTLHPGDATKGQFKVVFENQELEDAVVLYAGVTLIGKDIYIGTGTVVEPGVYIMGPAYIGRQTEVRQGAYLRGSCLVGDRCVVGHVTEMKNSVMLNGAKAGHFAYIGDSLLGRNCNLGAGTKLANLKVVGGNIQVKAGGIIFDTGLRKFGVVMGDGTETGCNSVTNPGTLLGPRSIVGPNATVKAGYYPGRSVVR